VQSALSLLCVRKALPTSNATFVVPSFCATSVVRFVRPLLCSAFRACSLSCSLSLSLSLSHTHTHTRKTCTGSAFRAATMCVRDSKLEALLVCEREEGTSAARCVRERKLHYHVCERGSYTTMRVKGRKLHAQRAV